MLVVLIVLEAPKLPVCIIIFLLLVVCCALLYFVLRTLAGDLLGRRFRLILLPPEMLLMLPLLRLRLRLCCDTPAADECRLSRDVLDLIYRLPSG